ncbi:MAG: hypothetical protein WBV06_04895 [Acidimicrobiia bacterium]
MEQPEHPAPAIFATRNPDATMHLASLAWEPLPDGTLLLECRDGTTTTENLRRDSFCWVVLHPGRLPAHRPDDHAEVHLVGKAFLEPTDGKQGRDVIRFCPHP